MSDIAKCPGGEIIVEKRFMTPFPPYHGLDEAFYDNLSVEE